MSRGRERSNPWDPPGGWPLDRVLVGVGTLRTMRAIFHRQGGRDPDPLRAWDLALRANVSVQGAADSLQRLEREGLLEAFPPADPGGAARYRLDATHPLHRPLARLVETERRMVPRPKPYASPDGR